MPRFDGTGPTGQGPMTGRRMGPCEGSGRGFHHWFGNWGRPWCWHTVDKKQALSDYRKALEEELEELKKAESEE